MKSKFKSSIVIYLLLPLVFALVGPTPTPAQTSAASINGHVKDPQGANLPGATVRVYRRDRTFGLTTTTDSNGAYSFERLAAGEYLLEAEARGFAPAKTEQVTVERDKATTLDISLELSGVRSTVVVTASDTPQTVD